MTWTKDWPQKPKTLWWLRVRYQDGSASKPIVIRVEKNEKHDIIYRAIGYAGSWTIEEAKSNFEESNVIPEFAGPITPPEEER